MEALPRLRQVNAARGPLHRRDPQPLFQPPQRVAGRRAGHRQPLSRRAEAPLLRQGGEDRDPLERFGHCQTSLISLCDPIRFIAALHTNTFDAVAALAASAWT
jgi:hypothetical protein